eukprot:8435349-Ditylum_brightwellii.AAC.1
MEEEPSLSYKLISTKNMDNAVSVYNVLLLGHMMEDSKDARIIGLIDEDILENCWKAPLHSLLTPCH